MKDDIDIGLLSTGALVKKGYSFLIANVGKTVALITLAVTALVSFTEISFSAVGTEHFTSTLIMMLIASYIMYFSLEDAGEKLIALGGVDAVNEVVGGHDGPGIALFNANLKAPEIDLAESAFAQA